MLLPIWKICHFNIRITVPQIFGVRNFKACWVDPGKRVQTLSTCSTSMAHCHNPHPLQLWRGKGTWNIKQHPIHIFSRISIPQKKGCKSSTIQHLSLMNLVIPPISKWKSGRHLQACGSAVFSIHSDMAANGSSSHQSSFFRDLCLKAHGSYWFGAFVRLRKSERFQYSTWVDILDCKIYVVEPPIWKI